MTQIIIIKKLTFIKE